eukprot:scaffold216879_cov33-Prasinocladus_malaysianus.AAC.1
MAVQSALYHTRRQTLIGADNTLRKSKSLFGRLGISCFSSESTHVSKLLTCDPLNFAGAVLAFSLQKSIIRADIQHKKQRVIAMRHAVSNVTYMQEMKQ